MPSITYVYDNLGRLTAVVDPSSDTGIYVYDAVGNLLSIERQSSSVVSIIEFTPKSAPIGTSVTIHGTGFSTTPSENRVIFNGVPATVISATATQIVATVPSGAASGPIAITTPTGSTTSTSPFTVTAAPQVPAIAAVSPTIGVPGTAVTLTGTHFDTALANNKAMFNRVLATLRSATITTIETEVPPGTGSGRIAVSTPLGKSISSEDFFVPPLPRTVADVEFTGRIALGESKAVTIGTTNKIALVVFDGTAGQRVSLGVSAVSFGNGAGLPEVSLLGPYGTTLARKLVSRLGDDIDMEPLPDTGTYTIVVDPVALTGSLTLTLSKPVTGTITIGGPSVPVIIDKPGQDARVTFEGTAGQRMDLGVSEVSFGTGAGAIDVSILHPEGTTLASRLVFSKGRSIHTDPLPDSGTYTIVVDPQEAKTVSLTLTLSEPLTGALTIGGPSVPIALRPGQEARLTFEGTVRQRTSLGVTEVSFGTGNNALISILKPNETALVSTTIGTNGGDLDTDPLPEIGTYTIVVDPVGSFFDPVPTTASLTLILSEPVSGAIIIDGSSVPITLDRPGQDARVTFEGTAGQRTSLGISEVSFDSESVVFSGEVSIRRPNGTTLASTPIFAVGSDIDTEPLPDTGTYTIVVNPDERIVRLTLTLSEPVTGTLAIDGPSVSVTLNRPGQDAWLTFEGTAGQRVRLGVSEVSLDTIFASVIVSIFTPEETTLVSQTMNASGGDIDTDPLPAIGIYTVVVNPQQTKTASLNLTLARVVP
jgi:YD repeat-containing protein